MKFVVSKTTCDTTAIKICLKEPLHVEFKDLDYRIPEDGMFFWCYWSCAKKSLEMHLWSRVSLRFISQRKVMVCVPCILLPFLLAIYLKFIQPFVLKFVPQAWKARLDALLYPTATCPLPKDKLVVDQRPATIAQPVELKAILADGPVGGVCSKTKKYI